MIVLVGANGSRIRSFILRSRHIHHLPLPGPALPVPYRGGKPRGTHQTKTLLDIWIGLHASFCVRYMQQRCRIYALTR